MAGRLEGKVAIVTGGNSGIGEATVKLFAREGASVALMARREDQGRRVEAEVCASGGEATFIRCDVMERASIEEAVGATIARYGRIDTLFNNAGGGAPGEFPKESDDVWEQVITLNLTSTFRMTKACWRHLEEAGGGTVVNMSSEAAVAGLSQEQRALMPGQLPASYAAAKAGVEAFTRYAASAGSVPGIRVNCVRPGQVMTPALALPDGHSIFERVFAATQITPGAGTPEDIANAVLFLACDESRFINGQVLTIDGGAAMKV